MPAAGVDRFDSLLRLALADPSVHEKIAAFSVTPEASTPAQLREFIRSETARWGDVVRSQNIRLE